MPAHPDASAPHCGRPATAPQREKADELFDRLSSLLRDAADPDADPARLVREADRAFDTLHRHLSRGGALPRPWRDARH
ncbi:hypothetical protein [Nocardiopsis lambiniae]|uniref:Uncharacterized protein n=1 Tax=Nocardiopsis lambiniae TaxID=3075539 RepID=A0ABU2M664_9ACTN|nr:hypothetical protein [Nocardiopsis sp. DSM 44743]MDT0328142.1 hypothetical protein [Nocardiopsis sp. DSM 44743]